MEDAKMSDHRDLMAWQEAMKLAELVYRLTDGFPSREMYGLASQARRSAISIPSNIAEGAARNSPKELLQYLGIASGSRAELHTQLELASRLRFLDPNAGVFRQLDRVGQLVTALRRSLRLKLGVD
jgi:four helix bundle protein